MKLPELDKPFLSMSELSERWGGISKNKIIGYGLTSQLKFTIVDGKWNMSDRALNMYPKAKGAKLFSPIDICQEELELILNSSVDLRIKDIFPNFTLNVEIENSKNRYVTVDCLFVKLAEIKRFEAETDNSTSFKLSTQQRREQVLAELIEKKGLDELINEGKRGVWNLLTQMNPKLFDSNRSLKDSTVRRFFYIQKLIKFRPGRQKG